MFVNHGLGGYCRVFVMEDPADPQHIWGYHTLSMSEIKVAELASRSQQKRHLGNYPIPMARIGFLGRDDTAPRGVGKAMLLDAARRIHQSQDITAMGLILEPDGGPGTKLYLWYVDTMKFEPLRGREETVYCPLRRLLPELVEK